MTPPADAPAHEFERKFLVTDPSVVQGRPWTAMRQGYLFANSGYALRIRLTETSDGTAGAVLTLKGPRSGLGRPESEWEVPVQDGLVLLEQASGTVEKRRHLLEHDGLVWEVDVFEGRHDGLVLAEVEADEAAVVAAQPPPWAGAEVTDDVRYYNSSLAAADGPPGPAPTGRA
ncbi:CYTH domain-containing protein [Phycicoccus flavus]|uniref:CYTH domain-containing protein n=1 Tax=Phycicoccus flavus TaxID=2502783 RepID=UPI000FEBC4BD|nr:CYTH domain-containing protein [Phycicoccus flavus]NHA68907.1 CYTH domain-containing protein [Phycicoccus flavus]